MTRTLLAFAALSPLVLAGSCTDEHPSAQVDPHYVEPLEEPPFGEGFQLVMDTTAPAGQEIWACRVFSRLPAEGLFQYVNVAESRQTPGMHHADLMTFFYTGVDLAPGDYDCGDLYSTYPELMEDGVFIYTSQLAEDSVTLPEGIVAPLPSDAAYMYEVHYVNVSDEDVDVVSYLNAWTIPQEEVAGSINGDVNRDLDIHIPAGAEDHVEWTRCTFPVDTEILFLSSHTHERAVNFELFAFDGVTTGELVYENDDWHAPYVLRFDPPMVVPAGQGFEYRCHYENPLDHDVVWGFGAEDEMCQFGYVYISGDEDTDCITVESSNGPAD